MHVFVYGTLTNPDRVAAVLGDHEWSQQGPATLQGLHRVEGQYPTLAPGGVVEGQLLSVDQSGLTTLDRYEGVANDLYVRVSVPIAGADESAALYVGDPDRLGVTAMVSWPSESPFATAVRAYCNNSNLLIKIGD